MAAPTKAFANYVTNDADAASTTSGTFNSTGWTHVVVGYKHEGAALTLTPSDNKGSTGWASYTREDYASSDGHVQLFMAKIGTPGTGHTVTVAHAGSANRPYRRLGTWLMNSTTGEVVLVDEANAEGTGTSLSSGNLVNGGADVAAFGTFGEYSGVNWTAGSGWTQDWNTAGANMGQSRTDTGAGTYASTATVDASMSWGAVAASFAESSATTDTAFNLSASGLLTPAGQSTAAGAALFTAAGTLTLAGRSYAAAAVSVPAAASLTMASPTDTIVSAAFDIRDSQVTMNSVGASIASGDVVAGASALARFVGLDANAVVENERFADDDYKVRRDLWQAAAEAERAAKERARLRRIARQDELDLEILGAVLAAAVAEARRRVETKQ